jgi:predicted DCC family thiol-disulfide oxidoreductase YuxK
LPAAVSISSIMRLPKTAHTSRPWRIHELTPDFRLEDVWALPTPGGRDDFPRLVSMIASGDPSQSSFRAARMLWTIRWKVGELLGWDSPGAGLGSRVPTLRDRLPPDLRDAPSGPSFDAAPFSSLYLIEDEWAAEIANRTMHGVMHIGWVSDAAGGYHGQMAVLVKPNRFFGAAYMAAIGPFRHLVVYPAMLRKIERAWQTGIPASDIGPRSAADALPTRIDLRRDRRWALLYDTDCGFCTWVLSALLWWDRRERLRPIALQRSEADDLLRELTAAARLASWHLISPSGERHSGSAAVAPLLRVLPGGRLPAAALARFPRFTDRGYRWVAEHRSQLSRRLPSRAKAHARLRVQRREQGPPDTH